MIEHTIIPFENRVNVLHDFALWRKFIERGTHLCAFVDWGQKTRTYALTLDLPENTNMLINMVMTHENVFENMGQPENPLVGLTVLFNLKERGLKKHPEKHYLYSEEFFAFRQTFDETCFKSRAKLAFKFDKLNLHGWDRDYQVPFNIPSKEYLSRNTEVFMMGWDEDRLSDFIYKAVADFNQSEADSQQVL